MALPEDILSIINDLQKRVRKLESFPQPPNFITTNLASTSFSLTAAGGGGDVVLAGFNLHNADDLKVDGTPTIEIYKNVDGIDDFFPEDKYPLGTNWTYDEITGLEMIPRFERNSIFATLVGQDLTYEILVINHSASSISGIEIFCDWRVPQFNGDNTS